ncbi:hypothetical protein YDYSY3_39020 [Paenibacillus chitinolyticus]|uniref:hypothetical protein n=1 Tax=Paenibacillus chitinolyticus TaxID=79263 RepID=UPI0026E4CDE9|nr:hypothetical protein [Paenibacillus chitinolyticus]GKS12902.1 hypothetical protein YDYSY3_39020 [Paenibacillus chitinolyticus]
MKKTYLSFLTLIIVFCLASSVSAAATDNVPQEIKSAAEKGMEFFRSKVSSSPSDYGFASQEEANRAQLGEANELQYLVPEKIKNGNSLLSISKPSGHWEFIVTVDGKPKSFLVVGKEDGEYKVLEFGGNPNDFSQSTKNFEKLSLEKSGGSKVKPTILKVGNVRYLVGEINNREYLLSDISEGSGKAKFSNGVDNTKLVESKATLDFLKAVKENSEKIEGEKPIGGSGLEKVNENNYNVYLAAIPGLLIAGAAYAFYRYRPKAK